MNAEAIARARGGKKVGRNWRMHCVCHDDSDASLDIRDGDNGDPVVICRSGCNSIDVMRELRRLGLWPDSVGRAQQPRKTHATDADERERKAQALRIFDEAVDPRYTLAEDYLVQRGLILPLTDDVRFHPSCPRRGSVAPALVVLMRSYTTNKPQAIQRIYIDAKTAKKDRCEASPKGTLMLGPADGAAMMLTDWVSTFWECLSFCPRLFAAEGFETACALMQRGRVPVWALGDAGRIERLPVLFAVGQLVICADHDRLNPKSGRRAGLAAAVACRARWNATTHQSAVIWTVDSEGNDFADWSTSNGQEGVAV